jgi:AcrR family transcriptional regulator
MARTAKARGGEARGARAGAKRGAPERREREAPRSREEAKRETREALLEAGAALFGEEGLDAPSLDAICERAGFTRGAFYVHFRDRDDLLEAVMERVGRSFLDAVLGTGAAEEPLEGTVARFVRSVATGDYPLTRAGGVRPRQLLDACARSPRIRARYVALAAESLSRIRGAVQAGQRAGALRGDADAEQVATILLAAVIGAQTMIELGMPVDVARAAAALMALLSR